MDQLIGATVGGAISWLWDKYGKELIDKLTKEVAEEFKDAKENNRKLNGKRVLSKEKLIDQLKYFGWDEAKALYRSRLREQHRFTRLLGNPKPFEIEYTFWTNRLLFVAILSKSYKKMF